MIEILVPQEIKRISKNNMTISMIYMVGMISWLFDIDDIRAQSASRFDMKMKSSKANQKACLMLSTDTKPKNKFQNNRWSHYSIYSVTRRRGAITIMKWFDGLNYSLAIIASQIISKLIKRLTKENKSRAYIFLSLVGRDKM